MAEKLFSNAAVSRRDGVGQAWQAIRGNRMRSLLLILGVSIGVTTLLAIFTIVTGLSGRIRDDIVSANQPYIYISRDSGIGGGDRDEINRRSHLLPNLLDAIQATEGVDQVDYQVSNGGGEVLKYGQEKANFVQAFGSAQTFPYIFSIGMAEGRFFTANEVTAKSRVAVLGHGPAKDLFPHIDPIGKTLRIFGKPYRIVGTMKARDHIVGALGDNFVCLPWTTFEKDGMTTEFEDRNYALTIAAGYEFEEVMGNLEGTLRRERKLRPGENNDFDIVNSETFGDLIDKVTGGIGLVLVVLSSIGLMVGGIGVMNIMLISVAERTREIGVRMAVGARRQDVLFQVLVEAAILTGLGGILGICVGYFASWGMTHVLRFPFTVSVGVTLGAAAFSVSIGMFFGLYPANKAAKLDPIIALSHD
ncbi:MAG: putative ABC transport system permease protein [Candidatus Krumholzibacteriia bacterium]|jgi:putative ABC transport system permease protein